MPALLIPFYIVRIIYPHIIIYLPYKLICDIYRHLSFRNRDVHIFLIFSMLLPLLSDI